MLAVYSDYVRLSLRNIDHFDVVVGLAWSYDPERYAGGSVAAGSVSHARQIKDDDPDNKRYPDPPGWWLGVGLTALKNFY
jgi:hypothetical protein